MGKYFGTDGVRAVAGQFPLTDDFIKKLGYCALKELAPFAGKDRLKMQVVIARDTRLSGPSILQNLSAGIRAAGADVLDMGVAPTPAVAAAVKQSGSLCGVVISASHNPPRARLAYHALRDELLKQVVQRARAVRRLPRRAGTGGRI